MKRLFKCELCGKIFDDEMKAKQCEKGHEYPSEVKPLVYGEGSTYPYKVKVKFGNCEAVYRYDSGLWGM